MSARRGAVATSHSFRCKRLRSIGNTPHHFFARSALFVFIRFTRSSFRYRFASSSENSFRQSNPSALSAAIRRSYPPRLSFVSKIVHNHDG